MNAVAALPGPDPPGVDMTVTGRVRYALHKFQYRSGDGGKGTEMARAQCGTIRLKLLKIGALIHVTVRKVWVALAESCPWVGVFRAAWRNLQRLAAVARGLEAPG